MRDLPLALLTALLATACTMAPDDQPSAEKLAQVVAPPGAGFIQKVNYTGTGCPEKSTTSAFSPDMQVVTSIFSAFIAHKSSASDPEAATRNCLQMMEINVPPGWSYSLESVHYRGYAGLEGEVTASRRSLYMISGSPMHVTPAASFKGTTDKDFTHEDVSATKPGVWSPCGGGQVLWITTQTEVSNSARPSRGGQLALDTLDTELLWRRCP